MLYKAFVIPNPTTIGRDHHQRFFSAEFRSDASVFPQIAADAVKELPDLREGDLLTILSSNGGSIWVERVASVEVITRTEVKFA